MYVAAATRYISAYNFGGLYRIATLKWGLVRKGIIVSNAESLWQNVLLANPSSTVSLIEEACLSTLVFIVLMSLRGFNTTMSSKRDHRIPEDAPEVVKVYIV